MAPDQHEDPLGAFDRSGFPVFSPREMELLALRTRLEKTQGNYVSYHVFSSDMIAIFGEGCFEKLSLRLIESLHAMWLAGLRVGAHERCESCGESSGVERRKAMTAYSWDGTGPNPNADLYLCRSCDAEYVDHWTEMWAEYHSGLL